MTTTNNLGIWMDHASAHLMEFTVDPMETTTIDSAFTHQQKVESLSKGESLMHNKEQHEEATYYKQLMEVIRKYDAVLLFGPTTAKDELANLMKDNHLFSKIKVAVVHADKMTENQEHAFVKKYFQTH